MLRQVTTLLAVMAAGVSSQTTLSAVPSQDAATASAAASSAAVSSTSSAPAATHTIKVGFPIGQHAFSPASSTANMGDTIVFEMLPQNHSVVHMDPKSPCVPWDVAGNPKNQVWWSQFLPVSDASKPKYYDIVVDSKDPIWFYCSAPGSCINYQMVGVINPANSSDLAAVKNLAKDANYSLSPGEPIPKEDASSGGGSGGGSGGSGGGSGGSSLSGGAIAGIAIGALAAFALIGLLFFFVGRQKKGQELKTKSEGSDTETGVGAAAATPDHPPMYQDPNNPAFADPRYSMVPGSPTPEQWGGKSAHQSYVPPANAHTNPHRLSELPSQNYDPVEIYTPGLPEQHDFPTTRADEEAGGRRDYHH